MGVRIVSIEESVEGFLWFGWGFVLKRVGNMAFGKESLLALMALVILMCTVYRVMSGLVTMPMTWREIFYSQFVIMIVKFQRIYK